MGSLRTIQGAHEVKTILKKNTKMLFVFVLSFYHKYTSIFQRLHEVRCHGFEDEWTVYLYMFVFLNGLYIT